MKKGIILLSLTFLSFAVKAQWTSNGTTISTTQNVGIGTAAPGYKLDVVGNSRFYNIILPRGYMLASRLDDNFTYQEKAVGHYSFGWNSDSWNTTSGTLWQSSYGGMKFFTGGQCRIGINSSGNVGVGTDNPAYLLDVAGDIRSQNFVLPRGYMLASRLDDNFTYQNKVIGHYSFGWNSDSWNTTAGTLWQSGYGGMKFFTGGESRVAINKIGNVGLGTDNPQNKLDVVGTIRATEVKVETGWADFVFASDYKLRPLEEVKAHIEEHKHLPDIPSEKEVKENGVSLGEMQAKLLQKIEELTLYVIELKGENEEMKKENKEIKQQLRNLQDL
ncbi:coiled-coil domain-containing protein [Dysgonomonas macrotermitis]|uniref:Chaperone of endosialidase n=1 Tax=Dysgonomonas macrotermitis TaxID=1346286 RepID=A0A1M5FTG8_9BACT|nr:cell division protein ZapB [Dysgonomonas macrotermitis]SHF94840.1 hypothetical protein SAMN05444362_112110 [Dysgonomonas macrotermitis]